MPSLSSCIAAYLLNSLWLTPLLGAAGWVACRLLQRLGFGAVHRVWVLVLFASVAVPVLPMALPSLSRLLGHASGNSSVTLHVSSGVAGTSAALRGHLSLPGAMLHALSLCYLGACTLFSVRLLRSVLRTSALCRRARVCVLTPSLEGVRQEVMEAFGVRAACLETDEVTGPVVVGFRRPVLLLPVGFVEAIDVNDFRVALAHECAHLCRHDFQKNVFYQALGLPLAFHPFSWWIKRQIAESRELLCDRMAVERSVEARVYVRSLLRLAMLVASSPQAASFNAIGILDANILEARVMKLRTAPVEVKAPLRLCLLGAGLVFVLTASFAGAAAPLALSRVDASATDQTGEVFHVGKDVKAPVLVKQADPEFPRAFKSPDGTFSGTCEVALIVDVLGRPRKVHVVRSLSKAFDKSAVTAVKQYRFKPGTHLGRPVPVDLLVDVNFQKF